MAADPDRLRGIKTFPQLVKYLRDELEWPIESDEFDDLTFEYEPEELGLDAKSAVKVKEIKQLRPLHSHQPWGVFFINFEPKRLPVVVLRRILSALVVKKRQSAGRAHQAVWKLHDLLFISSYGESDERTITFAHFAEGADSGDLPTLRVLTWDDQDTVLHLDHAHRTLREKLRFPDAPEDVNAWRTTWSSAFTLRHREVITTSKALAVRLAELATRIRRRANAVLAVESEKGPLRKLHAAFQTALIHDLSADDFADMYAQTIAYGLLTARISRHGGPGEPGVVTADNLTDMVPVTNPFLRDLLETFLTVGGRKGKLDFDELGINEVVELLREANMEAVLRDFGDRNPQEDPVIHFYELFLKEYDNKKRVQRGVFYTPRPVVSYIVRSVHELLQTEFGLKDGLADTTTWGEMKARFDQASGKVCGAGFQPANLDGEQKQAKMPAPQAIVERTDPPLTAGSCVLRRPEAATIVQDAMLHFEGQRYRLQGWCVMPNHVHVVVHPLPGYELDAILHSWKSFTSSQINRLLGRKGTLWERESFDHLIRSPEDVERFVYYTEHNPVAAGFVSDPKDWPFSSCGAGFQPAPIEFVDPRQGPFVAPRERGELPHLYKEGGTYFITWRLLDAVELKDCGAGFQPAGREKGQEQARMPAPQRGGAALQAAEFKIPDGVSPETPFVQILDPATGTATFLVEVIDVIHKTMVAKWTKQGHTEMFDIPRLWNEFVPKHLLPRLHGYELMMAPYAIAHMKIGLKLFETGYKFGSGERARIYLTNALEPPQDFSDTFEQMAPALAHEAQAVNDVKRRQRFTVVIGNPPYSVRSANTNAPITTLVREYYFCEGLAINERQPKALLDDYVKFVRSAQERLRESGAGTVGMITNHGYLDNPTFRGMRYSLLESFRVLHVLDLHGNSNRKEVAPDGSPDENVFDIKQGVCITVAATAPCLSKSLMRADMFGSREDKYALLLRPESAVTASAIAPPAPFFAFNVQTNEPVPEYQTFTSVAQLFVQNNVGFVTSRDAFVIDFDLRTLKDRVKSLADPTVKDAEVGLSDTSSWSLRATRESLRRQPVATESFVRCLYRPFDLRWICYDVRLLDRPVHQNAQHMLVRGNLALVATRQVTSSNFCHVNATRNVIEFKSGSHDRNTQLCPLYVCGNHIRSSVGDPPLSHNLEAAFVARMSGVLGLGFRNSGRGDLIHSFGPDDVFNYLFAALYSPSYRARYGEQLRMDFPRVPLPRGLQVFCAMARLGGELVAIHLLESPLLAKPITTYTGPGEPEVVKVSYVCGAGFQPAGTRATSGAGRQPGSSRMQAGMPPPQVEPQSSNMQAGMPAPQVGTVWLDKKQTRGFAGVPEAVWNFHIGGYQVCHKWLKDRKGRTLSAEDIAHYQKIVVALNETVRIMAEIDRVIEQHGGWPGAFVTDAPRSS